MFDPEIILINLRIISQFIRLVHMKKVKLHIMIFSKDSQTLMAQRQLTAELSTKLHQDDQ